MMYLSELSHLMNTLHTAIEKSITDLPDEALDWSPGPEFNSLGVLIAHTLGAERFWIGDIAGEKPSGRIRADEFAIVGKTVDFFTTQARNILAHSQSILANITPEELNEIRRVPDSDRQVTVAWAVLHALEHTALHVGHIELTRQLWEYQQLHNKEE